jgi:hypothetical protein
MAEAADTENIMESESVSSGQSRLSFTETIHITTSSDHSSRRSVPLQLPVPAVNVPAIMTGYKSIRSFWKQLVAVSTFREAIYYEIYRCTHLADGAHWYNRYFTTLESLVNRSNTAYYPFGVLYKDTGYTFIEDFLDTLSEETLLRILA